jgi:hypothetical protein
MLSVIMLSVIMLSFIMLGVIMLSVIMLSIVAPINVWMSYVSPICSNFFKDFPDCEANQEYF